MSFCEVYVEPDVAAAWRGESVRFSDTILSDTLVQAASRSTASELYVKRFQWWKNLPNLFTASST